jgi:solute carrier family 13 (sodium-dependent dicarboxylate transporter), member 2/3/5
VRAIDHLKIGGGVLFTSWHIRCGLSSAVMPDGTLDPKGWIKASREVTILLVALAIPLITIDDPVAARVVAIGGVCLLLWLLEIVPPFVPTLLLWVLVPVFLSPLDPKYSLANTLRWASDPVLALFFGGFALGVAIERHGLDSKLAALAFNGARSSFTRLLLITIGLTAFMSMWISNIAAAALMFASLRPLVSKWQADGAERRTLLVGVALGANLGGIATPIGTGPNAIAIASLSSVHPVTFLDWMSFAVPLTVGLLLVGFVVLKLNVRNVKELDFDPIVDNRGESGRRALAIVFAIAVILWLTESLHGIPAAVIALGAAASLFLFRLLGRKDLARIDWSTLLLIAGGITLGRLLEASGIVSSAAGSLSLAEMHPMLTLFIFCFASATLAALMSNTASVVLLIPLANAVMPEPSTAILIAVSASFGMPFIISTPPNAMAHGEGGLRSTDLLYPGLAIMLVGCVIVSLTGRMVLNLVGIP